MKRLFSFVSIFFAVHAGLYAQERRQIIHSIMGLMPEVYVEGMVPLQFPVRKDSPAPDTISVAIAGDVMLHQSQIDNCRNRFARLNGKADPASHTDFDFTPCLAGIKDILSGADVCIVNMEFTLAGAPFSGYPAFAAPDSYARYVADCGADVFLTANNHILDKGKKGIVRTLEVYDRMKDSLGILNTGCFADSTAMSAGYPLFIETKGIKIALVNFTYGTNVDIEDEWPKVCRTDTTEIAGALRKAREGADVVIALPHWGTEYALKHSSEQERIARFLAENGADAIVGSHPHVVQDIGTIRISAADRIKSIPVIYSLGNLISNMSAANTQTGLVVTLRIAVDGNGTASLLEPEYTLTWCSLPGRQTDGHSTIPIREYLGKREEWINKSDYDKMTDTYKKILQTSGIKEK